MTERKAYLKSNTNLFQNTSGTIEMVGVCHEYVRIYNVICETLRNRSMLGLTLILCAKLQLQAMLLNNTSIYNQFCNAVIAIQETDKCCSRQISYSSRNIVLRGLYCMRGLDLSFHCDFLFISKTSCK